MVIKELTTADAQLAGTQFLAAIVSTRRGSDNNGSRESFYTFNTSLAVDSEIKLVHIALFMLKSILILLLREIQFLADL